MQDIPFYANEQTKVQMSDLLYLWAKDNPTFGYRQGMNEILAIIVHVIQSEIVDDGDLKIDDDFETLSNKQAIQLIFGES